LAHLGKEVKHKPIQTLRKISNQTVENIAAVLQRTIYHADGRDDIAAETP
jgi:hypothetical protein